MEDWGGEISEQNVPVLILMEGLTMYLNAPLRGRCPEGAEGENLAIARNISDSRTVLSPTACGRSPLAEGAKEFFGVLGFPLGGSLFYLPGE